MIFLNLWQRKAEICCQFSLGRLPLFRTLFGVLSDIFQRRYLVSNYYFVAIKNFLSLAAFFRKERNQKLPVHTHSLFIYFFFNFSKTRPHARMYFETFLLIYFLKSPSLCQRRQTYLSLLWHLFTKLWHISPYPRFSSASSVPNDQLIFCLTICLSLFPKVGPIPNGRFQSRV